jgi:predicted pyridoxine 5'-phosphate oxidase superfamily flavin-nucleotide-binding protein
MVSLALPVMAVAAPGAASACGSAVYLSRVTVPDFSLVKPVALKRVDPPKPADTLPLPGAKPSDIVPPFPGPRPSNIVPPFPGPRPKPRREPAPAPEDRPLLVADAEEALSQGKHAKAAAMVVAAFPALKQVAPGTHTLVDRALRVLALATVRRDGRLDLGGMKGRTDGDRAANLAWSADVLGSLNEKRANNPAYQTDLGEALARLPARRADAAKLLGDLADRDLVTTAEGYAALARLRAEQGDDPTRATLLERCAHMTKTPGICAAPEAGAGRT